MPLTIDAHQHFWELGRFDYRWIKPDLGVLRRDHLPEHLAPDLAAAGIARTICVQATSDEAENPWALGLAARYPFIGGVVGYVDLAKPGAAATIEQLADSPLFVGVRLSLREPVSDAQRMGLAALSRAGLTCDLLLGPADLRLVPPLARTFPDLSFIIDHLANPPEAPGDADVWARDLAAVAAMPNVWAKLSGLVTLAKPGGAAASLIRPWVDRAIESFGPRRLMFGSDWPVCRLAMEYGPTLNALRDALGPLAPDESARIWGRTAGEVYGLSNTAASG